jgi:ribonuclease HI
MSKREIISLFTDASICDKTGAGGWGYWVKGRGRHAEGGNAFREPCENSNDAEIQAVANALAHCVGIGMIEVNTHVLVQCDSAHAIQALSINRKDPTITPKQLEARNFIIKLAEDTGFSFSVRHIKGHKAYHERERGHHVQDRADAHARQAMQRKREELHRASR